MIPKANKSVKYLILSVLEIEVFEKLNKSRKDFIVSVLWHILSIKGRINFLQLGRFSTLCEQTYSLFTKSTESSKLQEINPTFDAQNMPKNANNKILSGFIQLFENFNF